VETITAPVKETLWIGEKESRIPEKWLIERLQFQEVNQ
jgi:hypothetical protein